MKRFIQFSIPLLFLLIMVMVGGASRADELSGTPAKLQAVLDKTLKKHGTPGGVLGVRFPDGKEIILVSGVADLVSGRPLTPDLHFRIGSVTKTFTSAAMMILIEEGKADLNDNLEKWLPGLMPEGGRITIKMLLNHTNGLYDFTHDDDYQDIYTENLLKVWTSEELLSYSTKHPPVFPPGDGWEYTNTGYVILGLLVEKISGESVEEFISGRIIQKLGLAQTSFPTTPEMPGPFAKGYFDRDGDGVLKPEEDVTRQDPSVIWSAGAMISTPGDLLKWLDAIITGKLLDRKTQQKWMTFDAKVPEEMSPNSSFGLGLANNGGAIGHTGAILGYTTDLYHKDGVSIVTYTNSYYVNAVNAANDIYDGAVEVLFPK